MLFHNTQWAEVVYKKECDFHGNETAYKNGHEVMGTGAALPWILGVIAHRQRGSQAVEVQCLKT